MGRWRVGVLVPPSRVRGNWMSELGAVLRDELDVDVLLVAGTAAEAKLAALEADVLIACEDDARARSCDLPVHLAHTRTAPGVDARRLLEAIEGSQGGRDD